MEDSLVIVIPAYNEEETIGAVLREWYKVIELHSGGGRSRLLVMNDGSTDRTEAILKAFAREHPLFLYRTQTNGGHGAAIWNGYRTALQLKADYIFQTDSDGQTTSADFQAFWACRSKADVVMGRRVHRGDGRSRVLVSRVLAVLIRMIFRVRTEDANCPYRLMGRNALREALSLVPKRYHLTNVILSVAFEKLGSEVLLLPIRFRRRQGGKNSIDAVKIIKIGVGALWEFLKLERTYHLMAGGRF